MLAYTVFEILTFKIVDLQKVCQGHEVQFWHLHHSMANVQIYKGLKHVFALTLIISGTSAYTFYYFSLRKVGQGRSRSAILSITPFECRCQNLQMYRTHICPSSHPFRYITISNISPSKSRSMSRSKFSNYTIRWHM